MKHAIKTQEIALVLLVGFSIYLHIIDPLKAWEGFTFLLTAFVDVTPMFIIAVFLAGLIRTWVNQDIIVEYLGVHKSRNIPIAAGLGIITPGPVYSIYPLVGVIRDKGASSESITTFIFAQTMIGPMRAALEIAFFSAPFFAFRVVFAFILAALAGIISAVVFRVFPSLKVKGEMRDSEREKILSSTGKV